MIVVEALGLGPKFVETYGDKAKNNPYFINKLYDTLLYKRWRETLQIFGTMTFDKVFIF